MSINALPPNRFTPSPQQARLNPQVAQQRQGVTFPKQATIAAFEEFGLIVHDPKLASMVGDSRVSLYDWVWHGIQELISSKDRFRGLLEVFPNLDEPHLSRMVVSLKRDNTHLGEGAEPLTHRVEFSPTSDPETVNSKFNEALALVEKTEEEMAPADEETAQAFARAIGSKVHPETADMVEADAGRLFEGIG